MPRCFIFLFILVSTNSFSQDNKKVVLPIHRSSIYFEFASSDIPSSEYSKLNELAELMDGDFAGYVKMVGHTDNIGTDDSNFSLSEKRIDAIIEYFISERKHNLHFVRNPRGEHLPVADNATAEGRRDNRRVELSLFRKEVEKPIVENEVYALKMEAIENGSVIKFTIKDQLTNEFIFCDIKSLSEEKDYKTYEAGKCDIWYKLDERRRINYEFYSNGYFHQVSSVEISPEEEKEVTIYLSPIKKGAVLNLTQVLFKGGKTELLKSSIPELGRLLKTLKENEHFTFEIGGHVNIRRHKIVRRNVVTFSNDVNDTKGDKDIIKTTHITHGVLLSEARAKKIMKYLEDNGIAKERMSFKGYGNSKMPYPQAKSKNEQAANRRVEIKVTGLVGE